MTESNDFPERGFRASGPEAPTDRPRRVVITDVESLPGFISVAIAVVDLPTEETP